MAKFLQLIRLSCTCLAILRFDAGKQELDQKSARRLIEVGGDSPEFHLLMAKALLTRNDDQKALEEFQKAAAGNRELPFLHFNLGMAYWRMEQFELGGRRVTEGHRELNPEWLTATNSLGAFIYSWAREGGRAGFSGSNQTRTPACPTSLVELAKVINADRRVEIG